MNKSNVSVCYLETARGAPVGELPRPPRAGEVLRIGGRTYVVSRADASRCVVREVTTESEPFFFDEKI
jgi:hypothetical protein